jgi:two-component system, OmpR family, sensor histidine kinase VicK
MKTNKNNSKADKTFLPGSYGSDNPEMNNILKMMEKLLHWAAIIESSDDAIISKSVDGYITSWNKGAQRLYGYTPEEIIGQPVSTLMPPEKKDDFPYIMNMLHEGKRVEHYETQRMTKDGRILHVSITVSPIRDSQGNIIGASKIARDITDRIENERRRDEFVSTASHELKTPITSQRIFGELLESLIEKEKLEELKPYIKKINQQTDKMTKLVEDLLELSRVQTARLKMEDKYFSFDDLIEEIIDNMQLTTKHKLILKGSVNCKIKGDRERIGQALTNLLTNAIKYSPKADKVLITLSKNTKQVKVSIRDFGIGIAKEFHHKIFERFFRVTDFDEKTYPGMGIGLFLSQEIIERHNGKMWVESKKGEGSTFYFTLPLSNGGSKPN